MNFRPYVTIAEFWRPEVEDIKNFEKFLRFFKKTTLYGKIFKIVPDVLIATPIDVLWSKFVKFGDWKSVKSCALLT